MTDTQDGPEERLQLIDRVALRHEIAEPALRQSQDIEAAALRDWWAATGNLLAAFNAFDSGDVGSEAVASALNDLRDAWARVPEPALAPKAEEARHD